MEVVAGGPPTRISSTRRGGSSSSKPAQPKPDVVPCQKTTGLWAFKEPDARIEAARQKASRLEQALQGVLVHFLVKEGEQFLVRARAHLAEINKVRATIESNIAATEARLERSKVVSEPVQEPVPPLDWAAEFQRLRVELVRVCAGRSPVSIGHPAQSSDEAANFLQERTAKRLPGGVEPIPTNPQDVEGWLSEKHLELRDPIELGDKESILALTDLIQQELCSFTVCRPL